MTAVPSAVPSQFVGLAGGVVAVIAVAVALFSVVLLIPIILIVANRAEPDQRGMRPQSVYLFGMSFVTLQLTFAGSVVIVTSIFSVIAPHVAPLTNSIARAILIGGLFVVLAGGTLLLHLGRGVETARGDGGVTGPNLRVMQSYAALVGFIYFLQLLIALAVAIYLVFALVAPGRLRQLRIEPERHPRHPARPRLRDAGVGLHRGGPLVHRPLGLPAAPGAGCRRRETPSPPSQRAGRLPTTEARSMDRRWGQ